MSSLLTLTSKVVLAIHFELNLAKFPRYSVNRESALLEKPRWVREVANKLLLSSTLKVARIESAIRYRIRTLEEVPILEQNDDAVSI
jgi:hypothetical protein